MPKKKRRHSVDPAVIARRREENARRIESRSEAATSHSDPNVGPISGVEPQSRDEVLVSLSKLRELEDRFTAIGNSNQNLRGELERLLSAYTTLVTNSFKLGVTLSEYDLAEPATVDRVRSKMNFFIDDLPRNCEKAGVKMANLTGVEYSPSLNVDVLNLDDFPAGEELEIDEVVEPLLTYAPKFLGEENLAAGGLLRQGVVTVKKKGS